MRLVVVALAALALAGCGIPVIVRNVPERPVPTAPMGVETDPSGSTTGLLNPQLGDAPTKEAYQDSFNLSGLLGFFTGNPMEGISTLLAILGIGVATHQRQKAKGKEAELARVEQERDFHKADAAEGYARLLTPKETKHADQ